jgi:hypothetical protein
MSCTQYSCPDKYIYSTTDINERIKRIDDIIDALEQTELKAAINADIEEYQINDGQSVIKNVYRNPESIAIAVEKYEKRKQKLINRRNGRIYVNRPRH